MPEASELLVLFCMFAGGAAALWLWPRDIIPFLPPQRLRAMPWGLRECLFALFMIFIFPGIIILMLYQSGFFEWVYGPEFHKALGDPKAAGNQQATSRANLWVIVIGLPFQVSAILWSFHTSSGTLPYQLGLTTHRWRQDLALGFIGWLVLTPVIFVLNFAVIVYCQVVLQVEPEMHGFDQLAKGQLLPVEWWLLAASAVVAAPVLEELVFRGILLQYLSRKWWGGQAALAGSLALAILFRGQGIQAALGDREWGKLVWELQPIFFVLLLAAVFELRRLRYWLGSSAIFGTAALFAMAHGAVWPSPVPLFPLGLVLGWLAYRTQSLVAPMLLHALFNSVAVVLLLLTPAQQEKGKELTTPDRRPPVISTSTFVPGSWWPRRM